MIALQSSLALVDICGGLSSRDGVARAATFRTWFSNHLGSTFNELSPDDLYQLRCGMLHQGRTKARQYDAIVFTLPDGRGNIFRVRVDRTLSFDLVSFCTTIIDAVESWWRDAQLTEPVKSHSDHVVRIRPDGMAPYIIGVPMLG